MLKMFLILLIVANAALAALNAGYLELWIGSGHEPQRLQQQINPEKIRLISGNAALPSLASDAGIAPAPAPINAANVIATPPPAAVACIELGNFTEAEASRLEVRLRDVVVADRLARRRVVDPSSFMVYIPPQGDKPGADRKAGELRRLGIADFFVMQTQGELRYAISLGIFKTRLAAEGHLAELVRQGVRSARVTGRGDSAVKIAFQLRGLDDAAVATAVKLAKTEQRDCAPL